MFLLQAASNKVSKDATRAVVYFYTVTKDCFAVLFIHSGGRSYYFTGLHALSDIVMWQLNSKLVVIKMFLTYFHIWISFHRGPTHEI